ncbi:alpha/beta hydrolase [Paenibacillus sp. J2TS4]|uniref:alpha/beta hydrolase n=1 Tax=Paenibacillus sp. J2TS4 TaxID=2807194 RepID=UPI001AFF19D9|nr:alpha/beta fold hydrolase [Paenibacillus sp. J2TS4]GIP32856.1 alpha/beta hydrolase [Paenibacillus sp. J2TS4]
MIMTIAIAAAVLIVIVIICIGIAGYVGWNLTHPEKKPLTDSPANYGLSYEEIQFPSKTGEVQLKGWFLPTTQAEPKMTILFAHGYSVNRLQDNVPALLLARSLNEAGYPVVLFDFRNSGESEGSVTSVGQLEKDDLLGAVDWVKSNHPGRIGVVGFSMGASAAIMAAAEEEAIAGVVADSPFNHLTEYLKENLSIWSDLPHFPFTKLILLLLPRITGLDPDQVDVVSATDRVYPRPILFIHSTDDDKTPCIHSEKMWEKHPDRFELWKPAGGGHVGSYPYDPKEYTRRVISFLDALQG